MHGKRIIMTSKTDIEARIYTLAQQVLNGRISGTDIVPVEIEVYLYSKNHPDDTAQRHPLPLKD